MIWPHAKDDLRDHDPRPESIPVHPNLRHHLEAAHGTPMPPAPIPAMSHADADRLHDRLHDGPRLEIVTAPPGPTRVSTVAIVVGVAIAVVVILALASAWWIR